jgi:hypothetical protein
MRACALAICLAAAECSGRSAAAEPPASPASNTDARLILTGDAEALSGAAGSDRGGGGSVIGLYSFNPAALLGAGIEYQRIANAHWATGALSGSFGLGLDTPDTQLYGEVHEGGGNDGVHPFRYSVAAVGVLTPWTPDTSVQLEERRIDVYTSHGNLPKLSLISRLTPNLLSTVSYEVSVGGNLGTRLGSARLDYVTNSLHAVAGAAGGRVSPVVVNLAGNLAGTAPSLSLAEGFLGVGLPFGRTEWLLLGDFQDISGTKHTTITLVCTVHLAHGRAQ